jgi:ATP-dependent RNA circularization protein (DNA/RNA ligase family)
LSEEELELIWSSSKIDEATKLELYKVLNEISSRMKINQITFIIERLGQKKLENVIIEEIELVHELAKRSRSAETEYGDLAVQFMWKIAFNSQNKISSDLVN